MNVRTYMTPHPETIGPRDVLAQAQEKMSRGRFRRLPVVDASGALIGMLTERDLRPHQGYLPTTHVDAAMTENAITVGPDTPIEAAADVMLQRKIGGLPVVDSGKLVGIITETDLLQGLLRSVSGGEDGSSRIDFEFTTPEQTFAIAVEAVEAAGATILGLGTLRTVGEGGRTFYLRVLAKDIQPLADILQQKGYRVRAVHPSPQPPSPQPPKP